MLRDTNHLSGMFLLFSRLFLYLEERNRVSTRLTTCPKLSVASFILKKEKHASARGVANFYRNRGAKNLLPCCLLFLVQKDASAIELLSHYACKVTHILFYLSKSRWV